MLGKIDVPFLPNFAWFQTQTFKDYKFFDVSNKDNSFYFR